ncbi:hypothetical protein [Saccharicrinis carchari]|uniref:hypothetical protein n=1 Tax=Saccharicrinis carchari TaxID=1168039 RepID=UPI001159F583|nr:hypothetical protein [Saccharicrinis carchari]
MKIALKKRFIPSLTKRYIQQLIGDKTKMDSGSVPSPGLCIICQKNSSGRLGRKHTLHQVS